VRKSGQTIYLLISIAALVIGSTFLFRGEGSMPAVNPVLALLVSSMVTVYFWVATRKALEVDRIRPIHDLSALIGAVGEAKTPIHEEGSVQVAGELWSAQSDQPIPEGARIRVLGRDGFILKVEAFPLPAEVQQ
jgi:membrane-bound serine protease (ClpP class)